MGKSFLERIMTKKRLLITGISGLLGSNLAYRLSDRYTIAGFYHSHPIHMHAIETRSVDLRYSVPTEAEVKTIQPDVIIHCAAQANVDDCEHNKELAWDLNVKCTKNLLAACRKLPAKFIYISTDLVYGGFRGNYNEKSPVKPRNYYALTKIEAERAVSSHSHSLILRTNFFGWNVIPKLSLAEWVVEELSQGRSIQGFTDAYFSSLYTFDFAELIHGSIQKGLSGIYNCGSSSSLSKYHFLVEVARSTGLDESLIRPVSIDASGLKAVRGKNLSLDVSKLKRDLGLPIPTIKEGIDHFVQDLSHHYRALISSSLAEGNYYPFLNGLPYGRQCLDDEDIESVLSVLKSSNLTQGPKIEEFERRLANYVGAANAVAVNAATSALHVACLAADVGPGDEVITSANTFVASANCAMYCGARPVFADIDSKTYNLDPKSLRQKLTPRTKAVIPVHFAGQSCDMKVIAQIVAEAEKKFGQKIFIIEDAAHALGSIYDGAYVGSCQYSDMAIMSFHPVKHITTGEGGAILTNDKGLDRRCTLFRSHGLTSVTEEFSHPEEAYSHSGSSPDDLILRNPWYYEQQLLGYNYRITDIQCALGVSQLNKLPRFIERRREIVNHYNELFEDFPLVQCPFEQYFGTNNFHLYVIQIDFDQTTMTRAELMNALYERGIVTQVHYIPVHTQPYYRKNFGTGWGDCPVAEQYYRRCLSLPLFPGMTDKDVIKVTWSLKQLLTTKQLLPQVP